MPKQITKRSGNKYAPYIASAKKVGAAAVRYAARAAVQRWRTKKAKKLNRNVRPVGSGSSMSFYSRKYKARMFGSIHKKLSNPRQLSHASGLRLESTVGAQCATTINQFEQAMFTNIFTNLVDNSSNANQAVYVRRITQEYLISNASSSNTFIKIFECTARRDFTTSSTSSGNYTTAQQWLCHGAFDHGISENLTGNGATTLGTTPFDSKLFTLLWKVDRIINVELGAGRSHKHQSDFIVNKIVTEARSSRNSILGGISRGVMILAYGSPVNSTTNSATVTTSAVALNLVSKQMITVSSYSPQGGQMAHVSQLTTTGTYEQIDEDGDVQNVVTT